MDGLSSDDPNRLTSLAAVSSPFRASCPTFAVNSGAFCLRFDLSALFVVED
jgi:hypothetical protein